MPFRGRLRACAPARGQRRRRRPRGWSGPCCWRARGAKMAADSQDVRRFAGHNPRGDANPARGSGGSEQAATKKAKARIVVADDEASSRSALATLLSGEGFEVVLAEDGP